jgi:hypothetical protein
MRAFAVVLLCAMPPAGLDAQTQPSFEISAHASYWRLDGGNASSRATTRWGPTLAATFRRASTGTLGLRASASYAPEADAAPGLVAVTADLLLRPWRSRSGGLAPYLSMGIGGMHFAATRLQQAIAACTSAPGCLFEGVSYGSGWRGALDAGLGVQVGMGSHLFATPELGVVGRLGSERAGPIGESTFLHLSLGLGWR